MQDEIASAYRARTSCAAVGDDKLLRRAPGGGGRRAAASHLIALRQVHVNLARFAAHQSSDIGRVCCHCRRRRRRCCCCCSVLCLLLLTLFHFFFPPLYDNLYSPKNYGCAQ